MPELGWSINRMLYLITSVMFAAVFIQVTLFHYRQNFRHWAMWGPVLGTPALALIALTLFFVDLAWLRYIFVVFLVVGAAEGLGGFYYHVTGVGKRVGGYKFNNFLTGPPPMLPLTVTVVSLLGLIAVYWR